MKATHSSFSSPRQLFSLLAIVATASMTACSAHAARTTGLTLSGITAGVGMIAVASGSSDCGDDVLGACEGANEAGVVLGLSMVLVAAIAAVVTVAATAPRAEEEPKGDCSTQIQRYELEPDYSKKTLRHRDMDEDCRSMLEADWQKPAAPTPGTSSASLMQMRAPGFTAD